MALTLAFVLAQMPAAFAANTNIIQNGSFAGSLNNWTNWTFSTTGSRTGFTSFANPGPNSQEDNKGTLDLTQSGLYNLNIGPGTLGAGQITINMGWNTCGTDPASLNVYVGGTLYASFATPANASSGATTGIATYSSGASGSAGSAIPASTYTTWTYYPWTINLPTTVSPTGSLQLSFAQNGTSSCYADISVQSVALNVYTPSLKLTKVSNGSVGAFRFAGNNGWATQTITTTTAGTGVSGAIQALTSAGVDTVLTETPVANSTLVGFSCTDSNSALNGNTGTFGTFSGTTLTIPSAKILSTSAIACTVTNLAPTVTFQKISTNGTSTFNFNTPVNIASAPGAIATATAGIAAPATPAAISISAPNTAVQLTEQTNGTYGITGFSCTDSNSGTNGNTGTFGSFSGQVLTIPATNVKPTSTLACVIRNTLATVKYQKVSVGGTGTFSFGNRVNLPSVPASIATSAENAVAPPTPTAINISALGADTKLTETPAAGFTLTGFSCSDANAAVTGNTGTFGTFAGSVITIPSANVKGGADITCVITNTKADIRIQKISMGGTGAFTFTASNTPIASSPLSISTTAANTASPAAPAANAVTTVGTKVTLNEGTLPAGYVFTSATCTDNNAAFTGNSPVTSTTLPFDIPAGSVKAGSDFNCVFTNTKRPTLQLSKAWGTGSAAADTANIGATTGGTSNTAAFTAAGGTAASSASVQVTPGDTITLPAETFTPAGSAANYTTALACTADGGATANALSGTDGQASNTLLIGTGDAGKAIVCTYTNTRKSTTLTLSKAWGSASISGNVASIGATTGLTNNTTLFTSTASTGASSTAVTVYAGETATLPAETMTTGTLANYSTGLACTGGTLTGSNGQSTGNTLAITAASTAAAITCTYTNTRKSTTLTLSKAWGSNSISGNVASIGATTGLTNNTAVLTSTASTNSSGTAVTVYAGETATLPAETMTTGTLANYSTGLACTGGTLTGTDGQATGNTLAVTAASTAAAITCTYTNTRKSTTLKLSKAWGSNSISGNVASIGATTGLINNTAVLTSTASTNSSGTAVTVYAGETATLPAETMTTGTLANYSTGLACTGGTLSGTDGQATGNTLAVTAASTAAAITCTYTNTRKSTTLTLSKAWGSASISGNVASIGATTGLTNNTATFTSTAATSASSTAVTVYAGETATLPAETMTTGTLANYSTGLACTGGTLTGSNGQSTGNTLAITAASTAAAITCTYTNTRQSATFKLSKAWGANAIAGNVASIGATTGLTNNTTAFTATASTGASSGTVTVYAGETVTMPAETMTTGSLANYVASLACTASGGGTANTPSGSNGKSSNTLLIGGADGGKAVTCVYTNTRLPTLSISKTSLGGTGTFSFAVTNDAASPVSVTTTASGTAATGTLQTLTAAGTATTITETIPAGYAMTAASCSGIGSGTATANLSAGTMSLDAAATAAGNAISCSFTNSLIDAVDDDFSTSTINGTSGGTTSTVFTNDRLGGAAVTASTVTATLTNDGGMQAESTSDGSLSYPALNADGTIVIPPGTSAGTYTLQYKICSVANPTACDTASVTVVVSVPPQNAASRCTGTLISTNGGFESPAIGAATYSLVSPGSVAGWTTTDTAIEIWSNGYFGFPAYSGSQFVEANANNAGTLTTTGNVYGRAEVLAYWAHRARVGTDVAALVASDNAGTTSNFGNFSASPSAWVQHNTSFVTAPTATTFSLAFTAVSSGKGSLSYGNFLDGVEACQTYVTLAKTEASRNDVDGSGTDTVGDIITYNFAIANPAGNARSVTPASIVDDKIGTITTLTPVSGDTNSNGKVDPGETWTVQATYTLVAADIAAGSVVNTAYVTANTGSNTIRSDNVSLTATLNSPPQVTLTKISNGGVGAFTFNGTNGFGSQSITTVTSGTGVAGTRKNLTAAATATTITETIPTGYAMTGASCTGIGSGTATPNLSAGTITFDTAATALGNNIACTITNTKLPTLTLTKTSLGAVGGFTFTGTNGWTSQTITTVTAGTGVSGTTQTLTAASTATTITETIPAGYAMTSASCSGIGSGTATPDLVAGTIALNAAATAAGNAISCSITNTKLPTLTLTKTSLGAVGGFTFTGTNGWTSQTITTVTAGTGVTGTTQTLTTASTATTITEAIPAGYAMTAASCSGLGSGTATPDLAAGTIALNAAATAAGNAVTCSITNTKLPTLTLTKTSLGAVGGFTFTGTNGWTSQTITTVTAGTGVSGTTQTLTAASTATTITETIPAGYAMTAASCSGLGSGTATPDLAAGTIALNAAATAAGNAISCSITNTKLPTLTLTKTSLGAVGGFTFTGTNGWTSQTITTVTAGTGVTGTTQTLTTASTATTITEAIPAGYAMTGATCSGIGSGTATPDLAAGTIALNAAATAAGNAITCSITNTKLPTLTLTKTSLGAVGGFTFTGTNGWTSQTITTVTAGTGVSGTTQTLTTASTATTITEAIPAGYAMTGATCSGIGSGTATPDLAAGTIALNAAATAAGNAVTCSITNTKLPTLTLTKTSLGAVGGFTFTGTNGWTSQTITTVTSGTGVSGTTQTLTTASTATTITETIPAGYAMTGASCFGLGSGTATPDLAAGTIALNAAATAAGNAVTCSVTNTKLPTLTLTKTSLGAVGGFTFTGTNGWASQTITTVTSGTGVSGTTQTLTAASTATTITETIPAGYAMTAASCSGIGSGTATPDLAAGTIALNAAATAAGNAVSCSITDAKLPTLTINKTSTGGTASFTIGITNAGTSSLTLDTTASNPATASTTLTAAALTSGATISETLGTAYIMSAGSCSGLGSGSATVDLAGASVTLNAAATAAGATITCSITNAKAAPAVTVDKTASPTNVNAAGAVISYSLAVKNTGNVAVSNISVTDPMGTVTCPTSGTATIVSLAAGATETCTMSYTTTQTDLDGNGGGDGTIDNTAGASGTYASAPVTGSGSAHVEVKLHPELTVVKTADKSGPLHVGDVITYTYTITNSGNVTINGVIANDAHNGSGSFAGPGNETLLTDAAPTGDSTDSTVNGSWDHLAPGDKVKFTATYTVTQQDVDLLQ